MKENYSTRDYDDFIYNSTHGNRSRREQKSQFVSRERYDRLIQDTNLKIKRFMIIALATGVIGFAGGYAMNNVVHEGIPSAVEAHAVSSEIKEDSKDFRSEFIRDNVDRTEDKQNYWYDYRKIYKGLTSFGDGDYDKNLYFAYLELGSKYTSELLDESRFDEDHDYYLVVKDENGKPQSRSFRNYLYKNGYYEEGYDIYDDKAYEAAQDNFKSTMKLRFEIEHAFEEREKEYYNEQNERTSELNQMMSEHNMDGPTTNSRGGK